MSGPHTGMVPRQSLAASVSGTATVKSSKNHVRHATAPEQMPLDATLESFRPPLAPHRHSPPREVLDDVFIDVDPMPKRARQSGVHGFSKSHDIALGSKQRGRAGCTRPSDFNDPSEFDRQNGLQIPLTLAATFQSCPGGEWRR